MAENSALSYHFHLPHASSIATSARPKRVNVGPAQSAQSRTKLVVRRGCKDPRTWFQRTTQSSGLMIMLDHNIILLILSPSSSLCPSQHLSQLHLSSLSPYQSQSSRLSQYRSLLLLCSQTEQALHLWYCLWPASWLTARYYTCSAAWRWWAGARQTMCRS
jgi:hypothetical protein